MSNVIIKHWQIIIVLNGTFDDTASGLCPSSHQMETGEANFLLHPARLARRVGTGNQIRYCGGQYGRLMKFENASVAGLLECLRYHRKTIVPCRPNQRTMGHRRRREPPQHKKPERALWDKLSCGQSYVGMWGRCGCGRYHWIKFVHLARYGSDPWGWKFKLERYDRLRSLPEWEIMHLFRLKTSF